VLLEGAPPEAEAAFFSNLLLPGGAYKTTFAGRFGDLDEQVADLLAGKEATRLLDVGVSSGVTTVELIEALESRGIACSAVAADLVVNGRLVWAPFLGELLVDGSGRFLQAAGALGVRMRPYPRGARVLAAHVLDAVARICSMGGSRGEAVQLVTSRLAAREDCEVVEHDVFADRPEWRRRFDVVRAANLLNLSYFPPDDIRHALRSLGGFLAPGGLLVLCRTDIKTRRNDASILRAGEGGFEVVVRLGEGSEVEELALG
jgi:SAM-dependent methyltransferase